MAMHIVQLGPVPPPEGGVSRNMLAIRDELLNLGHKCTLVATTSGQEINDPHIHRPNSPLSLINLLRTLNPDIVHLHVGGEISNRVLSLAFSVSVVASGKCVLTVHSGAFPLSDKAKDAKRSSIAGMIFRRFAKIIGVNVPIADVFRRFGVEEDRIKVILPYALQRPDKKVKLRAKLADICNSKNPILLSVGGLEADYDPLFQVAAMPKVLANYPNACLLIIGGGSMRPQIEAEIAERKLQQNVVLAGDVPHAETLHLIDRTDILLRTTLFDGDAISVRESLFLGTPVIATDNGIRPDGVQLIQNGDDVGLLDQIEIALKKGKGKPRTEIGGNSNIKAVVDLYAELVRSKRR